MDNNNLGQKLFNLLGSIDNFIHNERELMMNFKKITGLDAKFIIKFLLDEGANVNYQEMIHGNVTPLHRAFSWHSIEIIDFLIENGADVNSLDTRNQLPIEFSIMHNQEYITLHYLQDQNFLNKLNIKDNLLDKLLWQAARSNKLLIMQFLIDKGANINGKTQVQIPLYTNKDKEQTPLQVAAMFGCKEAVEFLLRKGVDANTLNDALEPCLYDLREYGSSLPKDRKDSLIEIIKLLLRYGAKCDDYWRSVPKICDILNDYEKLILDQKQAALEIINFIPVPAVANIISQYYL